MRVLIVEDMEEKATDLLHFVETEYQISNVLVGRSFQSGLRMALTEAVDLILLDMTMTNFDRTLEDDGGRPHHFAGREILRQLQREDVHVPVVIVTNFDRFGEEAEEVTLSELKSELKERFPDYIGTVHYKSNVEDWKTQLKQLIGERLSEK